MPETEIDIRDFARLPLEKRAKMLLQDIVEDTSKIEVRYKIKIAGAESHLEAAPIHQTYYYLQEKKYVKFIDETPESKAHFKATEEGIRFMVS